MSAFHSDKLDKEKLILFKQEVMDWFSERFDISKMKVRALPCYNGDIRFYTGEKTEFTNKKSSFRRNEADKDENGNIIGYTGTRGHHTTIYAEYITINHDEWENIKNSYNNPKCEEYDFNKDYIFDKFIPLTK
jgi:hypothetical protein